MRQVKSFAAVALLGAALLTGCGTSLNAKEKGALAGGAAGAGAGALIGGAAGGNVGSTAAGALLGGAGGAAGGYIFGDRVFKNDPSSHR